MDLIISQQVAQAITDYLVSRPYGEVADMVNQMTQLQPLPQEGTAPTPVGVKENVGSGNGNGEEESACKPENTG